MKYFQQQRKSSFQEQHQQVMTTTKSNEPINPESVDTRSKLLPPAEESVCKLLPYHEKSNHSFTESETSFSDSDVESGELDIEYYGDLLSSFSDLFAVQEEQEEEPSSQQQQKVVRFSTVQVRQYSLTLGDHPYPDSYPISLDWDYIVTKDMSLDDYEEEKHVADVNDRNSRYESSLVRGVHNLTAMQRRIRLSTVGGIHPAELVKMERTRSKQYETECRDTALKEIDEESESEYDDFACHYEDDDISSSIGDDYNLDTDSMYMFL